MEVDFNDWLKLKSQLFKLDCGDWRRLIMVIDGNYNDHCDWWRLIMVIGGNYDDNCD